MKRKISTELSNLRNIDGTTDLLVSIESSDEVEEGNKRLIPQLKYAAKHENASSNKLIIDLSTEDSEDDSRDFIVSEQVF